MKQFINSFTEGFTPAEKKEFWKATAVTLVGIVVMYLLNWIVA